MRTSAALALVVVGHPALMAAVDLHIGGVQIDRHLSHSAAARSAGSAAQPARRRTRRRSRSPPPATARRSTGAPARPRSWRTARAPGPAPARRLGALAVQPDQEVLPGQLRRGHPDQQLAAGVAAAARLIGPIAASNRPITSSRSTNSVTATIPDTGVNVGSGAPIRTRRRRGDPVSCPPDRCPPDLDDVASTNTSSQVTGHLSPSHPPGRTSNRGFGSEHVHPTLPPSAPMTRPITGRAPPRGIASADRARCAVVGEDRQPGRGLSPRFHPPCRGRRPLRAEWRRCAAQRLISHRDHDPVAGYGLRPQFTEGYVHSVGDERFESPHVSAGHLPGCRGTRD